MGADDPYASLKTRIQAIYGRHWGRYGYRRITTVLRQTGEAINHKTVQRLMQQLGLKSLVRPKRYRAYRGAEGYAVPNTLRRRFQAQRPNQRWVTDITEFKVNDQKLYLSPVMDLYNSEIIAFQTGPRPVFGLVKRMLKSAFDRLRPDDRPYCTQTKDGITVTPTIAAWWWRSGYSAACHGKRTVWTIPPWRAFLTP